jgi:hypothetical protein
MDILGRHRTRFLERALDGRRGAWLGRCRWDIASIRLAKSALLEAAVGYRARGCSGIPAKVRCIAANSGLTSACNCDSARVDLAMRRYVSAHSLRHDQ